MENQPSENSPVFPNYPPPQPRTGLQHADPKQSAPLWKMAKLMMKPRMKAKLGVKAPKGRKSKQVHFK